MTPGQQAWARATLALDLLATAPQRLRGMTVRARNGPVRDTLVAAFDRLPQPLVRLHPAMPRDALLGGLDVTETLAAGRLATREGLLDKTGTLILTMAERCPPDLAAILAARLDENPALTLILLDEGAEPDESVADVLAQRLAFDVSLDGIGRLESKPPPRHSSSDLETRGRPRQRPSAAAEVLTMLSARLGIASLRLPLLALHAAQTHAFRSGREVPDETDIRIAAELVFAPRAMQLPEADPPEPEPPDEQTETKPKSQDQSIPQDILIEAVRAVLPPDALDKLNGKGAVRAGGTGAGLRRKGNRRGRPLPSRPGRLDGSSRLDLVATLRAAAPWQTIRNRGGGPVRVHPSDIRLKRYEDRSDRLVIFAVDASGSAALARLAEAKGAVELLLARAYAARDHVALIAFRGETAELLLPPTRSLVQTKRRLAALPGGGGTPLAAGLKDAGELAHRTRSQGLSPTLALLTDGRANIALDGSANRGKAAEDAKEMARWIRRQGTPAIVLDVGTRPQPALASLAREMAATYLPLPRADAHRLSDALGTALDHGLDA